ncbi:MAG: gamma carbonic anhydrase family protein [Paracoccaceae bacterium]
MIAALADAAPDIHPDAWVAPTAVVVGRVTLRAGASVWYGAVLRGDNEPIEIGEGANVQENSVLHTDMGFPLTVGAGATVGHLAMLHGCMVGAGALVGMGATMLNGSSLGDGALLGAGALLPEGRDVPAGWMALGAPAKPLRELTAEARQAIEAGALHYVSNAKRFRDDVRVIE